MVYRLFPWKNAPASLDERWVRLFFLKKPIPEIADGIVKAAEKINFFL